ncbi:hypothetical protein SDRG_12980 [Saprolegnia diclina VS20]|uniref:Ankyrin repeat protein n=1 Tax=Saprolegnia diclina (strain VS20) TaxID=1156394 RepID=T0Q3Y8_SAPDV|nr:hypothetical protein SDRG_12980 [Saprolegnia diclina VS20]EQC29311.1 hypothetical protein SDRG_12980 [Saprolegnia diclina VS20]|eukprot:XP_008617285.1 hypothetical protein SDRG_12980 [Saprolegnia diclina VS20]
MRLALGYGHAPVVRFLLQLPSTHVPLMMAIAADHGHVSLVQLLHDTNADPSHVWRGVMKRGHAHVARYLLAQPDLAQWPRAALRSALIDGHCALVQVLYAARAFELTTDEVVCALRSGRLEMVQFAYEHRATACLGALVLLAATEETMHILEWLCSLQAPERRHIERALDETTDAAVTSYLHMVLTRLSRVDASSPDRVAGHSL